MHKIAIILVGAVTSGKSTLAGKIGNDLNFEVVNEENTGNYFKIINELDSKKHPSAIYDHCYIYTQLKLFSNEYDEVILCFLKLKDSLLLNNYDARKKRDKSQKGDYLKINPLQQQNNLSREISEWESLVNTLPNVRLLTTNIESLDDYEKAKQDILDLVEKGSQHHSS